MSQGDSLREIGLVMPQLAQAKGIDNLSVPTELASETLSVLSIKDLPRFALLDAIADLTGYDWIKKACTHELNKRASVGRKGTRGRDDLVKILNQQEDNGGLLDSFKDRIKSFWEA